MKENPNLYKAFKGTQLDNWTKDEIKDQARQGVPEAESLLMPERFEKGPDFQIAGEDFAAIPWSDLTTSGGWASHVAQYGEAYGANGLPMIKDTLATGEFDDGAALPATQ